LSNGQNDMIKLLGSMDKPHHMTRAHLIIEGRVQGVFFRGSAQQEAVRLGLKGWVRNCPDGSVEIVAEGVKENIEGLISWCRHGPPGARVRNVQLKWLTFRGEFESFRITR
jgi:acylphosphatase